MTKRLKIRDVALDVRSNLVFVAVTAQFLDLPATYESHRSMDVLIVYWEPSWVPAVEPEDTIDRPSVPEQFEKLGRPYVGR